MKLRQHGDGVVLLIVNEHLAEQLIFHVTDGPSSTQRHPIFDLPWLLPVIAGRAGHGCHRPPATRGLICSRRHRSLLVARIIRTAVVAVDFAQLVNVRVIGDRVLVILFGWRNDKTLTCAGANILRVLLVWSHFADAIHIVCNLGSRHEYRSMQLLRGSLWCLAWAIDQPVGAWRFTILTMFGFIWFASARAKIHRMTHVVERYSCCCWQFVRSCNWRSAYKRCLTADRILLSIYWIWRINLLRQHVGHLILLLLCSWHGRYSLWSERASIICLTKDCLQRFCSLRGLERWCFSAASIDLRPLHAHLRCTSIFLFKLVQELGMIWVRLINMLPLTSACVDGPHILAILQHLLPQIAVHKCSLDAILFVIVANKWTRLEDFIFRGWPILLSVRFTSCTTSCICFPRLICRVHHTFVYRIDRLSVRRHLLLELWYAWMW